MPNVHDACGASSAVAPWSQCEPVVVAAKVLVNWDRNYCCLGDIFIMSIVQ